MKSHLEGIYRGSEGISKPNGRRHRESLLMGPNGGLKIESTWDGSDLVTVKLFGGR